MDAFFWAALGFLVASIVAGTAYVGVQAWRAWQTFVSLAVVATAGAEMLSARSAQTAAKAERAAAGADELQAAVDSLERSRARARVLAGAVEEMTDTLRGLTAFFPRK